MWNMRTEAKPWRSVFLAPVGRRATSGPRPAPPASVRPHGARPLQRGLRHCWGLPHSRSARKCGWGAGGRAHIHHGRCVRGRPMPKRAGSATERHRRASSEDSFPRGAGSGGLGRPQSARPPHGVLASLVDDTSAPEDCVASFRGVRPAVAWPELRGSICRGAWHVWLATRLAHSAARVSSRGYGVARVARGNGTGARRDTPCLAPTSSGPVGALADPLAYSPHGTKSISRKSAHRDRERRGQAGRGPSARHRLVDPSGLSV